MARITVATFLAISVAAVVWLFLTGDQALEGGAVAGPAGVRARAPAGFESEGAPHATPAEPHVSATAPGGRSGSSSTALDAPGVASLEGGFERRVALAVPEGTLPPGEIDTARQDARREILADAAIVEALARERFGPDASETQMALARGLGHTLLSTAGAEYRARQLEGLPELLGE